MGQYASKLTSPGGFSVVVITIRDLAVGSTFKFFARYKDGSRRPRFKFGPEGVRLFRAYARLNNHALGPCTMEITRTPVDLTDELVIVEHLKNNVTMVRDSQWRTAPVYSGMKLQLRTAPNARMHR